MFVRKKKNSSGSISVQIIQKIKGRSKVVETIGCIKDESEIEKLISLGEERIKELEPNLFDAVEKEEDKLQFLSICNDQIVPVGDELFFGNLFDDIWDNSIFQGLYKIKEKTKLFKALVISRILYPGSKLYLSDYLYYFKKENISDESIYRFVDTIYKDKIKFKIEKAIYNQSLKKLDGKLVVSFYDVTTLHFESESEDDLRKIGFSKEGKLNRPQIQLGLFTTLQGYPLAYEVFEGNRFEGHTLVDVLSNFQRRFKLKDKPIVVADRGMLNNNNLALLENNGYKYILGARIKNISNDIKQQITNLTFVTDGVTHELPIVKTIKYKQKDEQDNEIQKSMDINQRLILSYSDQRAKKDKYLRDKALQRLQKRIESSSRITKSDLKLSPYAKFIDTEQSCNITFKLNNEKVKEDEKLDGLKGYITNDTTLTHQEIIEHYQNLWHIEKAFRISKTDLQIRPIYHRLENRIKAHILISFVSYAIYREFEIKTYHIKQEYKVSNKIIRDLIKHVFAFEIDDKLIPTKLSKIQQDFYDALNT